MGGHTAHGERSCWERERHDNDLILIIYYLANKPRFNLSIASAKNTSSSVLIDTTFPSKSLQEAHASKISHFANSLAGFRVAFLGVFIQIDTAAPGHSSRNKSLFLTLWVNFSHVEVVLYTHKHPTKHPVAVQK